MPLQDHLRRARGLQDPGRPDVAEKIELQTRYAAELYNVDVRLDQRYMAEQDLFPCGERDESRFSPDFQVPLSSLELRIYGDPSMPIGSFNCFDIHTDSRNRQFNPMMEII